MHIEIKLERNFTFDQLIDKNVHVPDNGHSARVRALSHTRRALPRLGRQSTRGHGLGNLCSRINLLRYLIKSIYLPRVQ